MTLRVLTPDAKIEIMQDWQVAKVEFVYAKGRGEVPEMTGGLGYPDPDIYNLVDALNMIDGICVMQSCSGHLHPGEKPGENAMWSGELWIAMSAMTRTAYVASIHRLLLYNCIEMARLIFLRDHQDVASIIFDGLNKCQDDFEYSQHCILKFFREIGRW